MNCVVSGTFDPITVGHVDIIKRAAKMFDKVFVLVAKTSSKSNSVLTYDDKVEIIKDSIAINSLPMSVDYEIQPIENTLIDTMKNLNVNVIVRGLRNGTDLIYEMDMSSVNRDLDPDIETVYLPCRPDLSYVSSSMVRELCKLKKYNEAKKYCSALAVDKIHRKQMKLVALTGGIACGKSAVQDIFEKNGWYGIDLDKISSDVLTANAAEIIMMLNENFKYEIRFSINDTYRVFKKKVADLIFSNKEAKDKLEAFMHPRITKCMLDKIYTSNSDRIIVQVPLLFETGMEKMFDSVICVSADETTQIDRMVRTRGMSIEDAKARIASQMDLYTKMCRSDQHIKNVGSIEELETETKKLIKFYN